MVSQTDGIYLYNLTLQHASQITQAVHGVFAGNKQQWIAVSHGKVIELYKPDAQQGKLASVCSVEIFGLVRSLKAFRLTGGNRDYLIVGSDSGRISILQYDVENNRLEKVHMETFGKSGVRRIVPGEYLATDPKGRAVMIGAFEKQKLVYILNRDAAARLTISSPLEAHKSHTMVQDIVGVDVGFENPLFACLEIDYEDVDEDTTPDTVESLTQTLTFYELDLGLNHVVRKESLELGQRGEFANKLIPVPGGGDGPSGVLVCREGEIIWRTSGDHMPVRIQIPRRLDALRESKPTIINAWCMHKRKREFFFLLQTEEGDLFRLRLLHDEDVVRGMMLKYFDTVPVATSLVLLKVGILFVAAEAGDHHLYQILSLGDNEDEPQFLSSDEDEATYFRPRGLLNLALLDSLDSLSPILDAKLADIGHQDSPQLYSVCGRGATSTLRVLQHGLQVAEMASSELPGNPSAIWSVKRHVDDESDAFMVLSFTDATLVLGIGETVEEVTDSGFLGTVPTLWACRIGDDALLQIHAEGIRHIRYDSRVNEWKTPGKNSITHCAVNERQVAIVLSNGELVYFELDRTGQLNEYTERMEMTSQVTALALAPVAESAHTAKFLAIALDDQTVRVISLDQNNCLQPLNMQALPGTTASSLCIVEVAGAPGEPSTLSLNIGLDNGVLMRSTLDNVTADLSNARTRYLGSRAVKLFRIHVNGEHAVLALSAKPWLCYRFQGQSRISPLSYDSLEWASAFTSELCPEGMAAVTGNTLRIVALEKLGSVFHQSAIPLEYTGRKLQLDEQHALAFIAEGDQGNYTAAKRAEVLSNPETSGRMEDLPDMATASTPLDPKQFGHAYVGEHHWAANIRVVNLKQGETTCLIPLEQDEMVLSLAKVAFGAGEGPLHLVAGVVKGWKPLDQTFDSAFLATYMLSGSNMDQLVLVHKTPVMGGLPAALAEFNGRLLAGVGKYLRLFDLGKKKLLRKCENKHLPNQIVSISSMGTRIVVADQKESFFWVKFKPAENQLVIFADDTNPRWCSAMLMLDYNTVCGADKFGNIVVARLPEDVTDYVEEDPTGTKAFWSRGLLNGASQKMEVLANYHVGETILTLQKAVLTPGGPECVLYTTMAGGVGVALPFQDSDDYDFFQNLELHMRQEHPPLCGRDHLHYRSAYFPVKSVIDGDLCEQFASLKGTVKSEIAEGMDRSTQDIIKKIEDIRNRFAF
eukprot:TRINITY_DN11412_c0_g1_i1.p1 TRINITY_DN11412_c0_g1~~TRINITY_DN11412_c0_g1_i1.p1  ORF type:complete len:1210 (+),score=373.66 TRINITY_DN11412_c0_g1_i1:24-3653(+)